MQTALGDAGMQDLILGRRVFLVSDQWDIGFQLFQQGGAPLWGGGGALIEEGAPIPGGAQAQQHNNCGVLSYAGKLYINLTRNIREPKLERAFFTDLRGLGLHVKVESNQRD